jgi:hypothetical protein
MKIPKKATTIYLDESIIDQCDDLAKVHGLSRGRLMNTLLDYAINDVYHLIPNFDHSALQLRARLNLAFEEKITSYSKTANPERRNKIAATKNELNQ